MNSFTHKKRRFLMETEYLGNAYTTQSSNDGCVAVACPIDAGCAINACGTAACGANACPADICVTAGCVANVCINACTVDGCIFNLTPAPGPFSLDG